MPPMESPLKRFQWSLRKTTPPQKSYLYPLTQNSLQPLSWPADLTSDKKMPACLILVLRDQ